MSHGTHQPICLLTMVGVRYLGFHDDGLELEALVGIAVANVSHLLSAVVLYQLTKTLFPKPGSKGFCLATALLHVISPAGLFLSAPYAESSCALLTFTGTLLFAKSLETSGPTTAFQDLLVLISGIAFGCAATLRSNAILGGLLFLEEACRLLVRLGNNLKAATVRRLATTGLGGICVGFGFVLPQYLAYTQYCSTESKESTRPWCSKTIPSIYTFVQNHYW